MDLALGLGSLVCSGLDAWFTRRRILKYGVGVELSKHVVKTVQRFGVDVAVLRWVILPSAFLIGIGVGFHWTAYLGVLLGIKGTFTYFQFKTLAFEKIIEERLKEKGP